MVPACRVPTITLETVDAFHAGIEGRVLIAHCIDENVKNPERTRLRLQLPLARLLIFCPNNAGIELHMRIKTKLCGTFSEIRLYLGKAHKAGTPVGIRRIRKGVGVGPNVTGQPGIGM